MFVAFAGSTFAFGTCGIILVDSAWIMAYIAGVVTALTTSPAVVVAGVTGITRGRELALEIGDVGL